MIDIAGDQKMVKLNDGKTTIPAEELVVNNGRVQCVLVSIANAKPTKRSLPRVTLDRVKGRLVPHVLGVKVGQELEVKNSDSPILHEINLIHPKYVVRSGIHVPDPKTLKFDRAEPTPYKIRCSVHKWELAWMHVFDHPFFATTDKDGKFPITNVPEGEWKLQAWHEKLGVKTMTLKVGKDSAKADFTFEMK